MVLDKHAVDNSWGLAVEVALNVLFIKMSASSIVEVELRAI